MSPTNEAPNGPFLYTEGGNALRLLEKHAPDLRYCTAEKTWHVWDGQRWVPDAEGLRVVSRMKLVMAEIRKVCQDILDDGLHEQAAAIREAKFTADGKKLKANESLTEEEEKILKKAALTSADLKWAIESDCRSTTYNSVTMAKDEEIVQAMPDQFNADRLIINCLNGIIDLQTGKLRPHRREDMCSRIMPVEYDLMATCEQFERNVRMMFTDESGVVDEESVLYIQDFFGLALTGIVTRDVLILLGGGTNGKSTLVQAVAGIMGSIYRSGYAAQCNASTFIESPWGDGGGAIRSDIAALDGARLIHSAEYTKKFTLDMGLLKALTGGESKPTRDLHTKQDEIQPQGSIVILTNDEPIVPDNTEGTWARLKRMPCDADMEALLKKEGITAKTGFHLTLIQEEASGILNWLIEGCVRCLRRQAAGLPLLIPPAVVVDATNAYRKQQSRVVRFVEECCVLALDAIIERTPLYERYCTWTKNQGEKPESQKSFAATLERDYPELRPPNGIPLTDVYTRRALWKGIKLGSL